VGNYIQPRLRVNPARMNKTEAAYEFQLELLKRAGEIVRYRFEAVKLRLADKTFYTPDFMVTTNDQIQFHEVKGFLREDANVKFKVAAEQYPEFKFIMVRKNKDGWAVIKES